MSIKFGRYSKVAVKDGIEQLNIFNDIRARFSITMDTDPNDCELTIINLSEDERAFINREGVNVEIYAGYVGDFGMCFKGAVTFVDSGDQGTDVDCVVHLKDGEIQWGAITINQKFKEDTPQFKVIERLFKKLTGIPKNIAAQFRQINQGAKGKADIVPVILFPKQDPETIEDDDEEEDDEDKYTLPSQIKKKEAQLKEQKRKAGVVKTARDKIYRGAAFRKLDIFMKSFGLLAIWEKQTLHIIPEGAALAVEAPRIAEDTGLVGSPEKLENGWRVKFLIDHRVSVGSLIYVEDPEFTGTLLIDRLDGDLETRGQPWYHIAEGTEYAA